VSVSPDTEEGGRREKGTFGLTVFITGRTGIVRASTSPRDPVDRQTEVLGATPTIPYTAWSVLPTTGQLCIE
jgi:hypothetical protein